MDPITDPDWDAAFDGSALLKTFADDQRSVIQPSAEMVELEAGDFIFRHGEDVTHSVFPVGETMVSLSVELEGGRHVEVASIGREGAVGGVISCGNIPAFSRAQVLVGGKALRIAMDKLEQAKRDSVFVNHIFCRYADYLLSQVMQSVACNAFHSIQQRAARWLLLAQDRAGDRIELTQEAFAGLLGVQRTTVNAVIKSLQDDGLVTTSRGVIRVADRDGLKAVACECYAKLEQFFDRMIGPDGTGSAAD